jgi:hypothetical protein
MAHAYVRLKEDGKKSYLYDEERRKFREVLWGDYLKVKRVLDDGWLEIDWAARSPSRRRTLYIPKADTIDQRPLEIIFVDVGQGDGAVLISPETGAQEQIMVIDAGEGGNMRAFLAARFQTYRGFDFSAAVLTHPDSDHYYGFRELFADPKVGFGTVFHNGIVERAVSGTWEKTGQPKLDAQTGIEYLHDRAGDEGSAGQSEDPGHPDAVDSACPGGGRRGMDAGLRAERQPGLHDPGARAGGRTGERRHARPAPPAVLW